MCESHYCGKYLNSTEILPKTQVEHQNIPISYILASCIFAIVIIFWHILPQLKHISSISLVHSFLAYLPYKTQMNFICLPLQQSVKTSLKIIVLLWTTSSVL